MIRQEEIDKFGNLEILAKQVVEGFITGLHKSPFHGFSVEFAEHRLYNTGESTRYIDWKLFARTEKLFVKRFEEETNLRCQIVIDKSSSMFFPEKGLSKIQFAIYAAASIMNLLKRQRDAFGLTFVTDKIEYQSDVRSSQGHYQQLIRQLELLPNESETQKATDLSATLDEFAEKIHRRSLVVIFSDMMQTLEDNDRLFKSLQHLKFNKHEVILFHVQDKQLEVDFDFSNRPYEFTDMETGQKVKLQPNEIKEQYVEKLASFKKELAYRCAQYKIDFVEVDASLQFHQVLIPFLVKRTKLY